MGILTTQDSARSFSTYVAVFGLALLITSSIYLKNLNKWEEHHSCVDTIPETDGKFSADILCSNYYAWRRAAVIGIIIGVVDVLLLPFLLCCGCCLVCGCTALFCACINCKSDESSSTSNPDGVNGTESRPTPRTNDIDLTPATTTAVTAPTTTTTTTDDAETVGKCNLSVLPKPVMTLLNVIGWSVWVLLPFVGTLLIVIWISEKEAIRTREDDLYRSALTVYVVALLNLMVFYQKFIDSVCERCCGTKKKEKKEDEPCEV